MFYISEIKTSAPEVFRSELQRAVYDRLAKSGIAYRRVDCDDAVTMDDCVAINETLGMETVKTIFLCNRQRTKFYLFVTTGDKPFSTKNFGQALGISRVSFAPAELLLSMLGTPVGGASILSAVNAPDDVTIVFDKDVLTLPSYGCNDGTPTCYMKITVADVFKYLRDLGKQWQVIEIEGK